MQNGMSRGDEQYGGDGLGFFAFLLLVIIGIIIFFGVLQIRYWLNPPKKNNKNVEPELPKREPTFAELKELIIEEVLKISPDGDISKAHDFLNNKDFETLKKLHEHLVKKRIAKTAQFIKDLDKSYR
jgi:hypothetical protein